jgi:hypothetical protein
MCVRTVEYNIGNWEALGWDKYRANDVYTLAMRGLAGFEAILTREFHRIPRWPTPPHNHPRGDKSERYSCSTAYDTAIFCVLLLRTAYVTPKLPGILSPARLLRFSRVKSEYLLLLPRVYHRAYPRGSSVNDHIPAEWAALEYATVDQSIALIAAQGPVVMLITRDLQDAFRHIPTTQEEYEDRVEERGWRTEMGKVVLCLLACLRRRLLCIWF